MKNKGFTLIELLVTIAIISLLASIVFASVSSARDKANVKKAQVQAVEIKKAVELSRLSSGAIPFSNTDSSVSIKDNDSILDSLREYYSSIDNIELPIGSDFNNEDYYIFTEDGQAKVSHNGNDVLLTCQKDLFAHDPNNVPSNVDENTWDNLTSSWEADSVVVAYKKYREYSGSCFSNLGGSPYGGVDREKILDSKIVYSFSGYQWEVYDPYCTSMWVCI
jgi:prepilin-type N-terminal cleavage/methylation domain-containing protein